ncbi:50S ribosomal protein L35 [Candidatus Dojkabacteria bacterium]|nr:50S ribosomal protein L35 [Candidatus Dojkabacteria bacterium]
MKNKIKTHQATKKRFKVSKKGKMRHKKQGNNAHLKIKKTRVRKDRLSGHTSLKNSTEEKKLRNLIQ